MKLYRYFSLIKGYCCVTVTGRAERVLNAAAKKGIAVWDVTETGIDTVVFKTTPLGSKKLLDMSLPVKITVSDRRGLPFFAKKYRKRAGFLVGIIFLIAFFYFCLAFVWDINVYGNEKLSTIEIISALEKENIKIGNLLSKIDKPYAELAVLVSFPEIKWIQIETVGTTVNVYLKETDIPPKTPPANEEPTDVVAAKDGVIILCAPYNGMAEVKNGQTVKKGDLLISGRYLTKTENERIVHAFGKVMANTVNVIEVTVPLCDETEEKTGAEHRKNSIRLFSAEIKFYKQNEIPFEKFIYKEEKVQLEIFGIKLPIFLISQVFYETNTVKTEISEETAILKAENIANKLQFEQFSGIIVNDIEREYEIVNGSVHYECYLYCTEDIGLVVPVDMNRELKDNESWG